MLPDEVLKEIEKGPLWESYLGPYAEGAKEFATRIAELATRLGMEEGATLQRDMEPTAEMIRAGGSVEIDYETETHYSISIGYSSEDVFRAMQLVAPLATEAIEARGRKA